VVPLAEDIGSKNDTHTFTLAFPHAEVHRRDGTCGIQASDAGSSATTTQRLKASLSKACTSFERQRDKKDKTCVAPAQ